MAEWIDFDLFNDPNSRPIEWAHLWTVYTERSQYKFFDPQTSTEEVCTAILRYLISSDVQRFENVEIYMLREGLNSVSSSLLWKGYGDDAGRRLTSVVVPIHKAVARVS